MSVPARDPTQLRLTGLQASDARALGAWLAELASRGALLAADMSLGAWRSHHIAADLFAELGLPEPAAVLAPPSGERLVNAPSSVVRQRIDQETAGDRAALDAFRLAAAAWRALAGREPLTFAILIGAPGSPWEPGDAFFVRFLAQMMGGTRHRLVLACWGSAQPELPADWVPGWEDVRAPATGAAAMPATEPPLSSLVPAIVTPIVAWTLSMSEGDCGRLIPLAGGCLLVPPELRPGPDSVPPAGYDRLASEARGIPWLAAFAACHGTDAAPASFLRESAQRLFESGSLVVVLRVLDRAIARAGSPTEKAVLQLLGQSVLFAGGRFAEVGAAADPDDRLLPEVQGWLWHTKGWALTMVGRPAEAAPCLERARALLGRNPDRDEYLYVMNISALNQLKLGDWDGALAMEQQIHAARSRINTGFQLAYINSLNLARLYLRKGDYDASEQYYHEAFATSRGAWSDSDAVYYAVCLAKLNEARQHHGEALDAWARAALSWISSPVPEALGKRVVGAIVGSAGSPGPSAGQVLEDVSAALAARLFAGAARAGVDLEARLAPTATAAFVRPEMLEDGAAAPGAWCVLQGAGCWCLGRPSATGPTWASAAGRRLGSALLALLAPPADAGTGSWAILVDDRLGSGLPGSEVDLLSSCLRLGIGAVRIDGREISLGQADAEPIRCQIRVRLGNAVARVERDPAGDACFFKRYRPPRRLSSPASAVVRQLGAEDRAVPDGARIELLRELERDRIVEIRLPDDLSFERLERLVQEGAP
jgi:tetratricopeptide (TPR) repeat protein